MLPLHFIIFLPNEKGQRNKPLLILHSTLHLIHLTHEFWFFFFSPFFLLIKFTRSVVSACNLIKTKERKEREETNHVFLCSLCFLSFSLIRASFHSITIKLKRKEHKGNRNNNRFSSYNRVTPWNVELKSKVRWMVKKGKWKGNGWWRKRAFHFSFLLTHHSFSFLFFSLWLLSCFLFTTLQRSQRGKGKEGKRMKWVKCEVRSEVN